MSDLTPAEEFLTVEAYFWKAQYANLARRLSVMLSDLNCLPVDDIDPPEPPVGTQLAERGKYDDPNWTRREDGWHCQREDCPNCPADWREVCDTTSFDIVSARKLPQVPAATS